MSSIKTPDEIRIETLDKLYNCSFIGDFPGSIEVLMVPLATALQELVYYYPDITEAQLKTILKKSNIFVFPTVDDWVKYKGIQGKIHKRPRT